MLRPQHSSTRECLPLNGIWDFRLDAAGEGTADRWYAGPLSDPSPMAVPASYNDLSAADGVRHHVGDVWYQRRVRVPRGWTERVILHFESATHRATVWVDGIDVVTHEGGYLPFEADITGLVAPGEEFRLTVRVNNELTALTIPPGEIVDTPSGRRQHYFHDFFNYAGIHRTVWLASRPETHLSDITVAAEVEPDGRTGVLRWTVVNSRSGSRPLEAPEAVSTRLLVRDAAGRQVAEGHGAEGELQVGEVTPWAPGAAYLYDVEVQLIAGDQVVDSTHQRVGFRTVRVEGTRFLINGKPFRFTGFGMHEDHVTIGKQHCNASMIRDFELLRWTGANSLRTTHYPYSEDVLDHADRLGIVVISETPAVGLNRGVVGGIMEEAGETFGNVGDDTVQRVHAAVIRDTIARDRNHPCVVAWSIANEPESATEASERYFAPLFDLARACDPTRPVGFVNLGSAPHGHCRVSRFADLIMLNRYWGWYVAAGDLAEAERLAREELEGWATENKPIIITEYGADAIPGLHLHPPQPWSEEYQVAMLDTLHRVFDAVDAVVGEHVWNFADFATVSGVTRVAGNKKGAFTRDRQPKLLAHQLRRRWTGSPDPSAS